MQWLGQEERRRPLRVDAPSADAAGLGTVFVRIKAGSVVVAGPKGDVTLVWTSADKDRTRMLPPGDYKVRTTRVVREQKGVHWFTSSTAQPGRALKLKAGGKLGIEIDPSVHFVCHVKRRGDRLQLGFGVKGSDGRGLSVYRDGKRVPVTYKVLSKKGKVLASGTMNYG